MSKEEVYKFGEIIMEARNSGLLELKDRWFKNCLPKKPNAGEDRIASFISNQNDDERRLLLETVAYFVDASFFKLISLLESGSGNTQFSLVMHNESEENQTILIDPETDNSLSHAFFKWREIYGSLEPPT